MTTEKEKEIKKLEGFISFLRTDYGHDTSKGAHEERMNALRTRRIELKILKGEK